MIEKFILCLQGLMLSAFASNQLYASETGLSSNLPIIVIQTEATINADAKVRGTMKVIDNGEAQRNSTADTTYNYNGYIGIKLRGNSSLSFDQKKYTIETWDEAGNDINVSILGMPAESDWVLLAPYNDISLVRDVFAFNMWNEMGHWGPRTRMCEVIVNGEYVGIYIFCEKIKRDKNRVDISKLKEDDLADRDLTGGYIVRVDAFDETDATFQSKVKGLQTGMWGGNSGGTVTWTVYYPKKENLKTEQRNYIEGVVAKMEQSFQQSTFADPEKGYAQWIDLPSFVDYFIHTELSLNADGFKRSSYFFKDKDKSDGTFRKMEAGPVWDYNLAYGNCNFCNANNTEAWVYEGCNTNPTPAFWKKLTTDTRFMDAVRKRYAQLRQDIISQERINQFFDDYADLLDEAKERHYEKYGNLFSSNSNQGGGAAGGGWPWGGGGFPWGGGGFPWGGGGNTNPTAYYAAYFVESYEEEITMVKEFFRKRLAFLDRNWGYDPTSVKAPKGYFNIKVHLNDSNQLTVNANRKLRQVEVYSLAGNRLGEASSLSGRNKMTFTFSPCRQSPLVVVCHAIDGSYISYKIKGKK